MMKIGTYYYPEQWPREQWERDFDNIAAMGLQIVHMGEFAWFTLEPAEGNLQLDWLSQCVEMAAKRKLAVILCTPTASPPVWLIEKHPDVLPIDDAGRPKRFGGRRHYSPTAPALHDATRRIVSALAERFGNHPAVIGWQIDNEYSSDFFDQNTHAHSAFREWLRQRYGSIDAVNRAWGCQFWNTFYTSYDQIRLPANRELKYANPHQLLDACRFWSSAFAWFNKLQADSLRPRIGADRFLTTNFMPFHPDVNPADLAGELSLMAWDSYPCPGCERAPKDQNFRLGDPSQMGFMHDYMASFGGRWGLLEIQAGQINWGDTPVHLYPGAVRLWLWTAMAHGAQFVTTYRYRQPRFGPELFHHGLVGPDGVSPSLGGRQFNQTIDEVDRLDWKSIPPLADDRPAARSVGLVFDFEQLWYYRILPQSRRWDYPRLLRLWYRAIARLGLAVRILRPGQEWPQDLPLIVAPGLQMVDDAIVEQMKTYAAGGGHLVLTCRTALMDRRGQLFEGPTAAPIAPLIGGSIEAYDGLPDAMMGHVEMDGKKYDWGVWGDMLYADAETRTIAKYADQFYAGAAAVIQHKYEKGVVTYCGVYGEEAFTDALAERLATHAKLPTTPLPANVQLLRRGPYRILLNFTTAVIDAPAPARTRFVVGTRKVEPAGLAVWKEG
jgi:beta-galactosidase